MDQADKLRELMIAQKIKKSTHFIAITSGKGGVGKSTVSANLANLLASSGYKIVLFDADIGLANLDVLLNVKINKNMLGDNSPSIYIFVFEEGSNMICIRDH